MLDTTLKAIQTHGYPAQRIKKTTGMPRAAVIIRDFISLLQIYYILICMGYYTKSSTI